MKPVKLRLKIDLVSYPARVERLVNMIMAKMLDYDNLASEFELLVLLRALSQ